MAYIGMDCGEAPHMRASTTGVKPALQLAAGWYPRRGKRALDLFVGAVALAVAVPALVSIAAVLRFTLGPGIVYAQKRVGLHGNDFVMYKFRTMHHSRRGERSQPYSGLERRSTHKSIADPRHTSVGKLLRRTSLDELPQLLNVLSGEMSLVGPRPELASVIDQHDLRSHPRHVVKPGITGLWQVTKRNDGLLLHTCFDDDLPYLGQVTLVDDLRILVATAKVLTKPGGH